MALIGLPGQPFGANIHPLVMHRRHDPQVVKGKSGRAGIEYIVAVNPDIM